MTTLTATTAANGLSFADLRLGQPMTSPNVRRVTREDILRFADFTGDHNPVHIDRAAAQAAGFDDIIAHGMLVMSLATGLATGLGFTKDTVIFRGFTEWSFRRPVYPGDVLQIQVTATSLKGAAGRRPAEALLAVQIRNQRNKVVQNGSWVAAFR
jgi:3-hydroxybutyryl-CoA dehydratase